MDFSRALQAQAGRKDCRKELSGDERNDDGIWDVSFLSDGWNHYVWMDDLADRDGGVNMREWMDEYGAAAVAVSATLAFLGVFSAVLLGSFYDMVLLYLEWLC